MIEAREVGSTQALTMQWIVNAIKEEKEGKGAVKNGEREERGEAPPKGRERQRERERERDVLIYRGRDVASSFPLALSPSNPRLSSASASASASAEDAMLLLW